MIVFQMSDIHFGAQDEDALKAAERLIDSTSPDALIVCGDLTQRGKRAEFRAARSWLDQFGLPSLVVAGNHDTPLLNLVQRVASPFQRFEDTFDDYLRPLEIGGWRFVGLNTARGWQARRNWAEGV
ncbi:MAG: metallophosphoesterase, partial [Pseudomonadota bacterium]